LRRISDKILRCYFKMDNIFVIAGVIAITFLVSKFIEMRFIEKENKPMKLLIRDTLLVYFSVVSGYLIIEQFKPIMQSDGASTQVFTDNPEF
jgi:hypothetical protein